MDYILQLLVLEHSVEITGQMSDTETVISQWLSPTKMGIFHGIDDADMAIRNDHSCQVRFVSDEMSDLSRFVAKNEPNILFEDVRFKIRLNSPE